MRMQFLFLLFAFLWISTLPAQSSASGGALPEFSVQKSEVEMQLRFLASDALQGRRTGSVGNNMAAEFIAAHLKSFGYQTAPGADGYFQRIPFSQTKPPKSSSLTIHKTAYAAGEDFLLMAGDAATINAEAVFAGHGWVNKDKNIDDYAGLDVKGKIVFVVTGRPDANDPMSTIQSMPVKRRLAAEKGALALVEIYRLTFPWNMIARYLGGEQLRLKDMQAEGGTEKKIIHAWIRDITQGEEYQRIKDGKKTKVTLSSSGFVEADVPSQNVLGILEGTDPVLRNEYVLLTAHYDHVGTGKQGGGAFTEKDSIFNGARDNAFGTVALLTAAKALAQERPKRSVIVLAVTGEEIGMVGSSYYANHPLIPLEKTVFNLNSDGAGYNDTKYLSVIGFGRTGTDDQIKAAATAAGLEVFPDPAPEQNLFDRSDNVSFAAKGIPAVNISPGLTSFDDQIARYYHQVADEADSVDMDYLLRFCQAYAHLARQVADMPGRPQWKTGDKYQEAGKKLYGGEK